MGTLEIVKVEAAPVAVNTDGSYRRSKVFFWPEDFTVDEHLGGRFNRPYERLRFRLRSVWRLIGLPEEQWPETRQVKWSQKAGCSVCPCSPGFIVSSRWGVDLHVTYREVNHE